MITVCLRGNTYGIKETLKGLGFKWNKTEKAWIGHFDTIEKANEIAERWYSEGVYGQVITK